MEKSKEKLEDQLNSFACNFSSTQSYPNITNPSLNKHFFFYFLFLNFLPLYPFASQMILFHIEREFRRERVKNEELWMKCFNLLFFIWIYFILYFEWYFCLYISKKKFQIFILRILWFLSLETKKIIMYFSLSSSHDKNFSISAQLSGKIVQTRIYCRKQTTQQFQHFFSFFFFYISIDNVTNFVMKFFPSPSLPLSHNFLNIF